MAVKRNTLISSYGKSSPVKRSNIVGERGGDEERLTRVSQAGDYASSTVEKTILRYPKAAPEVDTCGRCRKKECPKALSTHDYSAAAASVGYSKTVQLAYACSPSRIAEPPFCDEPGDGQSDFNIFDSWQLFGTLCRRLRPMHPNAQTTKDFSGPVSLSSTSLTHSTSGSKKRSRKAN